MTEFHETLRSVAEEKGSIICLGLDPLLERIPSQETDTEKKISKFCLALLEAASEEKESCGIVKPNYAYYAQYGFPGLRALKKTIAAAQKLGFPVILDGKRGDIGKSSEAYAKELFEFWAADAVTVAPYMGSDSVRPFLDWAAKGKGVYILCRTSNKGSADFQDLTLSNEKKLYLQVAEKIVSWKAGAVVGATNIAELTEIASYFASAEEPVPLLIPGVGSQGGSAKEVSAALRKLKPADLPLHRINSSSGIIYAYEKIGDQASWLDASLKEIKKLNQEIKL